MASPTLLPPRQAFLQQPISFHKEAASGHIVSDLDDGFAPLIRRRTFNEGDRSDSNPILAIATPATKEPSGGARAAARWDAESPAVQAGDLNGGGGVAVAALTAADASTTYWATFLRQPSLNRIAEVPEASAAAGSASGWPDSAGTSSPWEDSGASAGSASPSGTDGGDDDAGDADGGRSPLARSPPRPAAAQTGGSATVADGAGAAAAAPQGMRAKGLSVSPNMLTQAKKHASERSKDSFVMRLHRTSMVEDLCASVVRLMETRVLGPGGRAVGAEGRSLHAAALRAVRAHFRALPARYALSVEPHDVLVHARLMDEARRQGVPWIHIQLAPAPPASLPPAGTVAAGPGTTLTAGLALAGAAAAGAAGGAGGEGRRACVVVACRDGSELLDAITRALRRVARRIVDADVMTSADGIALDRFEIECDAADAAERLNEGTILRYIAEALAAAAGANSGGGSGSGGASATASSAGGASSVAHTSAGGAQWPLGSSGKENAGREADVVSYLQPRGAAAAAASVSAEAATTTIGAARHDNGTSGADSNTIQAAVSAQASQQALEWAAFRAAATAAAAAAGGSSSGRSGGGNNTGWGGGASSGSGSSPLASASAAAAAAADSFIPFGDLTLLETVGSGRFSRTHRGYLRGQVVAVKVVELPASMADAGAADASVHNERRLILGEFERELQIVRRLAHPNVCIFHGASVAHPRYALVFEFLENGTLADLLQRSRGVGSSPWLSRMGACRSYLADQRSFDLFCIAQEVAEGMRYLHAMGVLHRDLKSTNILLDVSGHVRIVDFGLSCLAAPGRDMTAETGTYRWMAPEVIRHEPYSAAADVYSYAVVLWELITREQPFAGLTPIQAAFAVARQGLRPPLPSGLPPALAGLVKRCWHANPALRPSFAGVCAALPEIKMQLLSFELAEGDGASIINAGGDGDAIDGGHGGGGRGGRSEDAAKSAGGSMAALFEEGGVASAVVREPARVSRSS